MNKIVIYSVVFFGCVFSRAEYLSPPELADAIVLRTENADLQNGRGKIIQNIVRGKDADFVRNWMKRNSDVIVKMDHKHHKNYFVLNGWKEFASIVSSYPKIHLSEFKDGRIVKVLALNIGPKDKNLRKEVSKLLAIFSEKEQTSWRVVD